jgi:hypothetical protein
MVLSFRVIERGASERKKRHHSLLLNLTVLINKDSMMVLGTISFQAGLYICDQLRVNIVYVLCQVFHAIGSSITPSTSIRFVSLPTECR